MSHPASTTVPILLVQPIVQPNSEGYPLEPRPHLIQPWLMAQKMVTCRLRHSLMSVECQHIAR